MAQANYYEQSTGQLVIDWMESYNAELIYPLLVLMNPDMTLQQCATSLAEIQALGHYRMIGAYQGEELVGICGCWHGTKFYCGRYLEIDNFMVAEAARGQNIGGSMMEFLLDYAKTTGRDSIMLDVYHWNEGALKFYDRYGFESPGLHRVLWLNTAYQRKAPE